jgi:hypothetical protein
VEHLCHGIAGQAFNPWTIWRFQMQNNNPSKVSIGKRATDELKEFAIIAAYLYVCFAAIIYLKVSILKAHGIEFASFGFAAIKALICAKFVSLGEIFHVGERFKSLPLIWPTLYKSFIFLILLIILNAIEEITTGFIHNKTLADSLADFGGGTLDQLIASSHRAADINSLLCISYTW